MTSEEMNALSDKRIQSILDVLYDLKDDFMDLRLDYQNMLLKTPEIKQSILSGIREILYNPTIDAKIADIDDMIRQLIEIQNNRKATNN